MSYWWAEQRGIRTTDHIPDAKKMVEERMRNFSIAKIIRSQAAVYRECPEHYVPGLRLLWEARALRREEFADRLEAIEKDENLRDIIRRDLEEYPEECGGDLDKRDLIAALIDLVPALSKE